MIITSGRITLARFIVCRSPLCNATVLFNGRYYIIEDAWAGLLSIVLPTKHIILCGSAWKNNGVYNYIPFVIFGGLVNSNIPGLGLLDTSSNIQKIIYQERWIISGLHWLIVKAMDCKNTIRIMYPNLNSVY